METDKIFAKRPSFNIKTMHYEVVKCVKCGAISVVKTPVYRQVYPPRGDSREYVTINSEGYISTKIITIDNDRKKDYRGFSRNYKDNKVAPRESCNCIDGLCQNCIDENHLSVVFSIDNPLTNYYITHDNYVCALYQTYNTNEAYLISRISEELLTNINPGAYSRLIRDNAPDTLEEKLTLAEKYVELSRENIIEFIMSRIQMDEHYIKLKDEFDNETKEIIDFLQNAGRRVFRCSNLNYSGDKTWEKADYCPLMPDSVVSDSKFYKLEERYNAEKRLLIIKEHKDLDLFTWLKEDFENLFTALPFKIAKSHLMDKFYKKK